MWRYGVADFLERDAVAAHDRERGVPALVGVPVAGACSPGHLPNRQLRASLVYMAVLVAEDEAGVLPGRAGGQPFGGRAFSVGLGGGDGALGEFGRALGLGVS